MGYDGLFEVVSQHHVKLIGLRVENSGNVGIVIKGPNSSHIEVRDCYTNNTESSGISAWGQSEEGAYDGISHLLIDNCEVVNALNSEEGFQECLTVAWGVEDFEVKNCHVHDAGYGSQWGGPLGIDCKVGVRNGKVHDNLIHDIPNASGLYVDAWDRLTYNIEYYNNRIYNCADAGVVIGSEAGGELQNIRVYNNLIYNNNWDGIRLAQYYGEGTSYGPKDSIMIYQQRGSQQRTGKPGRHLGQRPLRHQCLYRQQYRQQQTTDTRYRLVTTKARSPPTTWFLTI